MGSWASSLLVGAYLGRIFIGSVLTAAHFAQGRDGRIHMIPHGLSLNPTTPSGQSWLGEVSSLGPAGRILPRCCSGTCCRKQILKDIFYKAMRWHSPCTAAERRQIPGGCKATGQPSLLPAELVLPRSTYDCCCNFPGLLSPFCPRTARSHGLLSTGFFFRSI